MCFLSWLSHSFEYQFVRSEEGHINPDALQDKAFPLYDEVKAEDVVPAMRLLFKELHEALDDLEANVEPTWVALIEPIERITDRVGRAWGTISHLKVHLIGFTNQAETICSC